MSDFIKYLRLACDLCERGSSIEQYKHVVVHKSHVRAFNGIALFDAPVADLDPAESFALSEDKLLAALSSLGAVSKEIEVKINKEFVSLKSGPLTMRVKKLDPGQMYSAAIDEPAKAEKNEPGDLLACIKAVYPFVSEDASRPWSISVMVHDGYVYATNNVSVVRSPTTFAGKTLRIPRAVLGLLLDLSSINWLALVNNDNAIVVGAGKARVRFPMTAEHWPDVKPFFKKLSKKMTPLPKELLKAAKTVEKFAESYIWLDTQSVSSKSTSIDSTYELDAKKGAGVFSSRLLALIAENSDEADFTTYPEPISFKSEKIEGVAACITPEVAARIA